MLFPRHSVSCFSVHVSMAMFHVNWSSFTVLANGFRWLLVQRQAHQHGTWALLEFLFALHVSKESKICGQRSLHPVPPVALHGAQTKYFCHHKIVCESDVFECFEKLQSCMFFVQEFKRLTCHFASLQIAWAPPDAWGHYIQQYGRATNELLFTSFLKVAFLSWVWVPIAITSTCCA